MPQILRPPPKPPAHQSKESNTCGSLDATDQKMNQLTSRMSWCKDPPKLVVMTYIFHMAPFCFKCSNVQTRLPTETLHSTVVIRKTCRMPSSQPARGRRAGLDRKFVKALEPSLANRLQDSGCIWSFVVAKSDFYSNLSLPLGMLFRRCCFSPAHMEFVLFSLDSHHNQQNQYEVTTKTHCRQPQFVHHDG